MIAIRILLTVTISLCFAGQVSQAETLDQALERVLGGKTLANEEIAAITDRVGGGPSVDGKRNSGSVYLHEVKRSIVNPDEEGDWPLRSNLVYEERDQAKTYRELKAIYEKHKTPVVAYALVCPAMFVNDFKLLPELFAKIGENKVLKARFDKVYASHWKPRLDPDF